jgi:hypothetical protein
MNWTKILADAGIPESPGRDVAVNLARQITAERYERDGGPKRARGTAKRTVEQVSRKLLQARERAR